MSCPNSGGIGPEISFCDNCLHIIIIIIIIIIINLVNKKNFRMIKYFLIKKKKLNIILDK